MTLIGVIISSSIIHIVSIITIIIIIITLYFLIIVIRIMIGFTIASPSCQPS